MKKMTFALQVFGLMAAFPVYLISELSRTPAPVSPAHTSFDITKHIDRSELKMATAFTVDFSTRYLGSVTNHIATKKVD